MRAAFDIRVLCGVEHGVGRVNVTTLHMDVGIYIYYEIQIHILQLNIIIRVALPLSLQSP